VIRCRFGWGRLGLLLAFGMLGHGLGIASAGAQDQQPDPNLVKLDPKAISLEPLGEKVGHFRLRNVSNQIEPDGATISTVAWLVVPPGAIAPTNDPQNPSATVSPLTILEGSTGFNEDELKVLLGEGLKDNQAVQAIGLEFGDQGFAPEGVLNFALSTPPSLEGDQLNLTDALVTGRWNQPLVPPSNQPADTNPVIPDPIPEPTSVLFWLGMTAVAATRLRARQRRIGVSA